MRDQHQRPAKFEQALFQNFQRGDVEIVGRLVQQQHVRRLEHELRDQNARAFAAGKPAHRLIQLVAREEKPAPPTRPREITRS